MEEKEIKKSLDVLDEKINAIYISVEKTRKYFFWTMIVSLVVFVLPLIGLIFTLPSLLSGYTDVLNGL